MQNALQQTGKAVVTGGVSANHEIRRQLRKSAKGRAGICSLARFAPTTAPAPCAGCQRLQAGQSQGLDIFARRAGR